MEEVMSKSKGVQDGSVNDGLALKVGPSPSGHVPAGDSDSGVDSQHHGGGCEEVVTLTSGTAISVGEVALRNPVVLARLFEVCDLGTLAEFRLVSKEWHDLSLKTWRASSTLKLERNAADGGLYLKGGTSLDEFLEYVEDPGNECGAKPFRRMRLEGWNFDPGNNQIQLFWNLLGNDLTTLKFHRCEFPDVEEFRRIIYTACPNLSALSFRSRSVRNYAWVAGELPTHYEDPAFGKRLKLKCLSVKGNCLPVSWLEVFSHFQSLTSFKHHNLSYPDRAFGQMWERMLNAIRAVREHNPQTLPLKQFDIAHQSFLISLETASQDKFFRLIRKLNLPLKSLSIKLHPDLDDELVNDILQFHSGTLEYLDLVGGGSRAELSNRKFHCGVQLEKVQKLAINHVMFQSTEILKCTPNLKSLLIVEDCRETRVAFDEWKEELKKNEAVTLPKLTRLTYFVKNGFYNASKDLETLTKLFPNVEKLEMALDDEHLAIVCQHWNGLKELAVNPEEKYRLSDTGMTGGVLHMIKPELLWKHETVRPNIKDLKELKVFSCNGYRLTDISVYHGLLHLPQLKSVTLDMEATNEYPRSLGLGFGEEAQHDLRGKGVDLRIATL